MEGLNSDYISSVLSKRCEFFLGVYAADKLPKQGNGKSNFLIICNLDVAEEKGSHFVTIVSLDDYVLYIDSLGLKCHVKEIAEFLLSLGKPTFYNTRQIQDFRSEFCGYYCILFVLYFNRLLSGDVTDTDIVGLCFDDNDYLSNDSICVNAITKLLK